MRPSFERPRRPADRVIVAADVPGREQLARLLDGLAGGPSRVKVGSELYTALGPESVGLCRSRGLKVFLDLKFHDIPRTVAAAVRAASTLGVDMLTVHAGGGRGMISAALDAAGAGVAVLAVTLLTSLGEKELTVLGLAGPAEAAVLRLAEMALEAGADGLVCSAKEAAALRRRFGEEPLLVTPGIRPAGARKDDQARSATAAEALAAGADWLVVGRPVCEAADPLAAFRRISAELVAV